MKRAGRGAVGATLEPLTRNEIQRRIQDLTVELAAPAEGGLGGSSGDDGFRWIAPAELIRRVRPHLVHN